ncbi:MAG: 30S ribosomal protein S5 [Patescibacteria group bacterium]
MKEENKKIEENKNNITAEDKSAGVKVDSSINSAQRKTDNKAENDGKGSEGAAQATAKSVYGEKRKFKRFERRPRGRDDKKDEFEQRILDIARVTRVMAGGKRMSFRACVAIGDKKGKVAVGLGKGADVTIAVTKAVNKAKKVMIDVPIVNETIPHEIFYKYGASKILFKPASKGRGVIAGGVVRIILELAGINNITSKILGTNNKVSNSKCTIEALKRIRRVEVKKKEEGNKKEENKKPNNKETITK